MRHAPRPVPGPAPALRPSSAGAAGRPIVLLALLTLLVVACGSGSSSAPPTSTPSVLPSVSEDTGSPGDTGEAVSSGSPGAAIPGQLEVGSPVLFPKEKLVGLLVRNVGDKVISIATKGTFTAPDGHQTATTSGAVYDLQPGEQRVEIMPVDGDPGPNASLTLQPASVVTEEQVPASVLTARQISFGIPSVQPGNVFQLVVPVTNHDSVSHSLNLVSPIIRDGQLVGIASGEIDDVGAGQTSPASLSVIGSADPKDTFAPAVDLVRS
ncbi:MAG TPA: hypothetical protein VF763_11140 [Candidatus Limnocylindrales bacterium]